MLFSLGKLYIWCMLWFFTFLLQQKKMSFLCNSETFFSLVVQISNWPIPAILWAVVNGRMVYVTSETVCHWMLASAGQNLRLVNTVDPAVLACDSDLRLMLCCAKIFLNPLHLKDLWQVINKNGFVCSELRFHVSTHAKSMLMYGITNGCLAIKKTSFETTSCIIIIYLFNRCSIWRTANLVKSTDTYLYIANIMRQRSVSMLQVN